MEIRQLLLGLFAIVILGSFAYAQGQATSAMGGAQIQMPSPAEMKPVIKQENEREVKVWDKNKDGELNEDEFTEMVNSLAINQVFVQSQFNVIDPALRKLPDILQKSVDAADDADNQKKVAEFEKAITAVFDEYDEDDNDMLSVDELTEYELDQRLAIWGMDDDSEDDDSEAEDADSEEEDVIITRQRLPR